MIKEREYLKALALVKAYQKQVAEQIEGLKESTDIPVDYTAIKDMDLTDIDIPVPIFNAIKAARNEQGQRVSIDTVDDLMNFGIGYNKLLSLRGMGDKNIKKLYSVLNQLVANK